LPGRAQVLAMSDEEAFTPELPDFALRGSASSLHQARRAAPSHFAPPRPTWRADRQGVVYLPAHALLLRHLRSVARALEGGGGFVGPLIQTLVGELSRVLPPLHARLLARLDAAAAAAADETRCAAANASSALIDAVGAHPRPLARSAPPTVPTPPTSPPHGRRRAGGAR